MPSVQEMLQSLTGGAAHLNVQNETERKQENKVLQGDPHIRGINPDQLTCRDL